MTGVSNTKRYAKHRQDSEKENLARTRLHFMQK